LTLLFAKFRGLMYRGKIQRCDLVGKSVFVHTQYEFPSWVTLRQSQRCISPRTSSHGISPNDSWATVGDPSSKYHDTMAEFFFGQFENSFSKDPRPATVCQCTCGHGTALCIQDNPRFTTRSCSPKSEPLFNLWAVHVTHLHQHRLCRHTRGSRQRRHCL
jgi:hypothetical protein